jgi:glycosyltransferase involved in cell wall biosynthesis
MRISVIMPVCLKPYGINTRSASDPEYKFKRAIQSYLNQTFKDSELIIISDGSEEANDIYENNYIHIKSIKYKYIDKQVLFSGVPRRIGIEMATGEIICYLDHDDVIGKNHLQVINDNFDSKYAWIYYNDYLVYGKDKTGFNVGEREVITELNYIGTCSVAHRRDVPVQWGDDYAHDWRMIKSSLLHLPHIKIQTPQYYVCHFGKNDF